MSEYDLMSHIPCGPGINAKELCKMVSPADLGMNRCVYVFGCRYSFPIPLPCDLTCRTSNLNNKGRKLHCHPTFFGSNVKEALEDSCEVGVVIQILRAFT